MPQSLKECPKEEVQAAALLVLQSTLNGINVNADDAFIEDDALVFDVEVLGVRYEVEIPANSIKVRKV